MPASFAFATAAAVALRNKQTANTRIASDPRRTARSSAPLRTQPRMSAPPRPTPKLDPESHSTLKMDQKGSELSDLHPDTRTVHAGVHRDEWTTDPLKRSFVNPPVYHASTIVFPTMAAFRQAASDWPFTGLWYGRHGNPTTFALEEAFAAVEGGDNACVAASGVAAVNAAILAFVQSGDHVLITDAVYDPTRDFCNKFLKRFGVDVTFFSPTASPDDVAALIQPNTRVVFVESPASLSFEVMDVAAIAHHAHERGAKVIADNTWGPTLFSPFDHGVDVSVNAATKYIGGHSDLMMGIVATKGHDIYRAIKKSIVQLGCPPGTDDVYLALRGLRTLNVRLHQHEKSGLKLARWLESRSEVKRVMHPGLPSHPQHDLFKRQFKGSSGLFGFQLVEGFSQKALDAMLDGMRLFCIGYSWGGYESLLTQNNINSVRSVDKWEYGNGYGQTLRINVGLEDIDDLIKDFTDGFQRLHQSNE